ncbi:MAG: xanthine dehydrogenase family protein subunit M [Chloroflexi bacterium]|nr:xanthine dehydrogenase family protein subunit M [Chloroflexota bacterium]
MKLFEYAAPTDLAEALRLMQRGDGEVWAMAGGTDLIDQVRQRRKEPSLVLDLKRVPELQAYQGGPQGLRVGAAVPCRRISSDPLVKDRYPALAESAALVGSVQIQNRATLGGNICNAAPSADTAPALLVYEARALIAGPGGRREVPLDGFFLGPGKTALSSRDILLELRLPPPPAHSHSHYLRFIPREEMDIAVAGVASLLALDPGTGRCTRARIALGAVAPRPVRALEAEALLEGQVPTEALLREAAARAVQAAIPISDVRGSAEYRKALIEVLAYRTLEQCLQKLRS